MIKTVTISDPEHLYDLIDEQEYRSDLKRNRNLYVYPGLDGLSKWLGRHYYVR